MDIPLGLCTTLVPHPLHTVGRWPLFTPLFTPVCASTTRPAIDGFTGVGPSLAAGDFFADADGFPALAAAGFLLAAAAFPYLAPAAGLSGLTESGFRALAAPKSFAALPAGNVVSVLAASGFQGLPAADDASGFPNLADRPGFEALALAASARAKIAANPGASNGLFSRPASPQVARAEPSSASRPGATRERASKGWFSERQK
jgi:hypothetical protein